MSSKLESAVSSAKLHNALPLLFHILGKGKMDQDLLSLYRKQYIHNHLFSTVLLKELSNLLIALAEKDVNVILLKGAAFSIDLYSDPGIRPMRDVDFLIRKADLDKVTEALRLSCYRRYSPISRHNIEDFHGEITFIQEKDKSIMIEPHWAISPEYAYSCRIKTEDFWYRAKDVQLNGIDTLVLCPEDTILNLCLHLFQHLRSIWLINACDIAELIRRYDKSIDWEDILKRVIEFRLCLPVRYSLNKTVELFDSPVPDFVLNELNKYKPGKFEQTIANLSVSFTSPQGPENLATLITIPGITQKTRYLYSIFFPSREWVLNNYSTSNKPLLILYFRHIINVISVGIKGLFYFICSSLKSFLRKY
jgi:hypothetical protein